jgi:hypothetical protein
MFPPGNARYATLGSVEGDDPGSDLTKNIESSWPSKRPLGASTSPGQPDVKHVASHNVVSPHDGGHRGDVHVRLRAIEKVSDIKLKLDLVSIAELACSHALNEHASAMIRKDLEIYRHVP